MLKIFTLFKNKISLFEINFIYIWLAPALLLQSLLTSSKMIYTLTHCDFVFFFFSDVAATEQIADMLMRAEEFWVQRQTDPSVPSPQSEEHCAEVNQDNNLPVKKLYV